MDFPVVLGWVSTEIDEPSLLLEVRTNAPRTFVSDEMSDDLCRLCFEVVSLIGEEPRQTERVVISDDLDENRDLHQVEGL